MSLAVMRPFAEMDKVFKQFDHPLRAFEEGDWMPSVDIEESEKLYMIRAELPGVEKKDIHVNVENNVLTIRGEKQIRTEDTKKHRIESSYGSFIRSFTLPTTVVADNIEAKFLNGILNLNIPKATKDEKPEFEVKIT